MAKSLFLLILTTSLLWAQESAETQKPETEPVSSEVKEESKQTTEASSEDSPEASAQKSPEEVLPIIDPANALPLPENVEEANVKTEEDEKAEEQEASKAVVGGTLEDKDREKLEKRILYKWDAPENVDVSYYIIEAYADNQLKKRVKKGKSRKNQIVIKLLEDETLYVRIAVKAKNGLVSEFSNLSKVTYDPKIEVKKKKKRKYALGLFYAASTGTFTETVPRTGDQASLEQNSPLTLGLTASYQWKPDWTIYSSVYISQFSEAEAPRNGNPTAAVPPLEIGLNAYAQTQWNLFDMKGFYYYFGLDFEIFQTFNTEGLAASDPLEFRAQNIFYLTGGVQKNFQMLDRFSFVKFSLSPTVMSSGSDNFGGEAYTGLKWIFYLHHTLWKRWGTGFFYKQHILSGPGDLTVTRYGINFSYRLF